MNVVPIEIQYVDHMGSDVNVVNAARVSFAKNCLAFDPTSLEINWRNVQDYSKEANIKLLKYLAKHGHWSPFAHTCITIKAKVPIALARQLVKHQVGGNWNEESRRYIDSEPEFWLPEQVHARPVNAKQGAGHVHYDSRNVLYDFRAHTERCLQEYKDMLEYGVAPEEARLVLPLNTMTNLVWTGSILFFHRVWQQRSDAHAQTFAREFADKLLHVIQPLYPHSIEALCNA